MSDVLTPQRLAVTVDDLSSTHDLLVPATSLILPNPLVHSNFASCGSPWFTNLRLQSVATQTRHINPLRLKSYPKGVTLAYKHKFCPCFEHTFDKSHFDPTLIATELSSFTEQPSANRHVFITDPCILINNYNISVWAHWLGDLLTKAVIAESCFPGRFKYVLSKSLAESNVDGNYYQSMIDSLSAYGIDESRLLIMSPDKEYKFSALMDVEGVWTGNSMHPTLLELMRHNVRSSLLNSSDTLKRVAMLRRDAVKRRLSNEGEVSNLLCRRGFCDVSMSKLSFIERVSLMHNAESIVGIWGSNLIYLIYARPEASIITLAPTDWDDDFITSIIQQLGCKMADIRGYPIWDGLGSRTDANFSIEKQHLTEALRMLH